MNDTSLTGCLIGLTVTLGTCLAFVLRFILQRTIPDMQAAYARQIDALTEVFRNDGNRNREMALQLHREMAEAVRQIGDGIQANQESLYELLQRTPRNGHEPLRLYQEEPDVLPHKPWLPPADGAGDSPADGPDDDAA